MNIRCYEKNGQIICEADEASVSFPSNFIDLVNKHFEDNDKIRFVRRKESLMEELRKINSILEK